MVQFTDTISGHIQTLQRVEFLTALQGSELVVDHVQACNLTKLRVEVFDRGVIQTIVRQLKREKNKFLKYFKGGSIVLLCLSMLNSCNYNILCKMFVKNEKGVDTVVDPISKENIFCNNEILQNQPTTLCALLHWINN